MGISRYLGVDLATIPPLIDDHLEIRGVLLLEFPLMGDMAASVSVIDQAAAHNVLEDFGGVLDLYGPCLTGK